MILVLRLQTEDIVDLRVELLLWPEEMELLVCPEE